MASSSSSSLTTRGRKYGVFLSFEGKDTASGFTSHLYEALCREKVETFVCDELVRRDKISSSVLRGIEESRISIVVFSQGYGSSSWCLDALLKILECRKLGGQIVIPVFYEVDPSQVRNQTGRFGEAFAELIERFGDQLEMLQRWRAALREAADLAGFDSRTIRSEAHFVKEIIKYFLKLLGVTYTSDKEELVGIQSRIKNIESLQCMGLSHFCVVGIWGVRGIGKTTVAKAVFNKICSQFESYFFAENVREESQKDGLILLRKELISAIFGVGHPNMKLTSIKKRLQHKKVLIVFDDVSGAEQIEQLIGNLEFSGLGSRFIIIAREKKVLKFCGVDEANIYKVEGLCDNDALQLFSWHAFGQNHPDESYMELSNRVTTLAQGIPLVLKALGSLLCGKAGQDWESTILKNCAHEDIQEVFKKSYDGLNDKEKNIFLDIACFFKGWNRYLVTEILDTSYSAANIGISILIEKFFITISQNMIKMHDSLQEMGRKIVEQESVNDPGKRSRLWYHKDVYYVLTTNSGTKAIQGICLDMSKISDIHLNPLTFSRMHNLRFLCIQNSVYIENESNKVHGFEGLEYDFTELRYLGWHGYTSRSLPLNFCPKNLVALDMPHSNLDQLSLVVQNLAANKYIDLSNSKDIVKSLYLSLLPNLRSLNLNNCSITELPYSLGQLSLLECLYVAGNKFESIPMNIINLSKLTTLHVSHCKRLQSLPKLPCHLENLQAQRCTSLQTLSGSVNLKPSNNTKSFSFINCSQLDWDAWTDIVKDALLYIQQNTIVCLEVEEKLGSRPRGCLCFPGSEIPECFNFQSSKSSIESSIELPQGSLNQNLVGLTFCTVLAFQDYSDYEEDLVAVHYEFLLKCKDGSYKEVTRGLLWIWDNVTAPDYIESDHIFLGYELNMSIHEFPKFSCNGEAIINFCVRNNDGIPLEYCKVKKCGVHLLYTQDFEEVVEESGGIFVSEQEEGEEEPNSSSSNPQVKYDVFLSFRGEDTHNKFTSHLHAALCRANIETFIDNEDDELMEGDETSSYLMNTIERSIISVIIFSKGYASSRLCLEELVKILECKKKYGQVVIPVFYYVDPSHVRNQTGTFGDAFAELEAHSKESIEMLQGWRNALREAANLSGFDSNVIWPEAVLIEEIVKHILKRFNDLYPSDNKNLVGVQSSIKKIESSLCKRSKDVCIVGLWGMGGVGKTTIARAVFNKICHQFEGCYFAENVREESEKDGLICLRKELLSTILEGGLPNIGLTFIKERLRHKNILIVFDDVTSLEQIRFLIGDLNSLGLGSRVVITTRDKILLTNFGGNENNMFEVKALFHHDALQLFSWYAFQQNRPALGYNELSNRVVKYAKGVPLVLKVLGSFLLEKAKGVWESAINKLEKIHHEDIKTVLKVSYEGLDDAEKNIFLDIACFLKLENRDFAIKFLDVSGFYAEFGLSVLIDRCLISISNDKIQMHDLLQEMGWEIVQKESLNNPGKRSRLWYHVDIHDVWENSKGTKAIEGICLDMSKVTYINLNPCAFAKMDNLRFLKVFNSRFEENNINKVLISAQDLKSVFTELRYLCWHGCPLKSLQSSCHPEKLVALDMPHSNVEQLWTGVQDLFHLKSINLSHSKHLYKSPDLSRAPNLENLILEGCTSLFEICSSIQHLNNLSILNLRHCKSLRNLPVISCNVEELLLDETGIEKLRIENLSRLVTLDLNNCSRLKSLPSSICDLKSLELLNLSGCSNLDGLPDSLGNLEALKVLKAERVARILPSSMVYLHYLMELNLTDCFIMELPSSLGQLSSLESLLLGRNEFESIPTSIIDLSKLYYLCLAYCQRLQSLPELPHHLQYVDAHNCTSLEQSLDLSILFPNISRYTRVNFINCIRLDQNALIDIVRNVMEQIQGTLMELSPRPSAYICFPGTEIPEWFDFKSMGSSVNFKLASAGFNLGLVSFAVCVIVDFQKYHDEGQGLVVGCEFKLGNRDGSVVLFYGIGPSYVDPDHVFLGYDLHTCSFDLNDIEYDDNEEVSIQFYVEDSNTEPLLGCEVRKCGVHLLYYHEIGNLDGKKEEEPPRKKLKRAFFMVTAIVSWLFKARARSQTQPQILSGLPDPRSPS